MLPYNYFFFVSYKPTNTMVVTGRCGNGLARPFADVEDQWNFVEKI